MSAPCMSRHFGNEGKPRPLAAWSVTYGCVNDHIFETLTCDPCATSLVDGRQRCGRCFRTMVVSHLTPIARSELGASGRTSKSDASGR